ncbi:MBL fold metallo-hydrolase [Streptomyces sp. VRA16 Mangrove soil]|uniref:MBL fold metallo-hydrolase n=1 Tax=Streptomyces sp. VRA16 Mangrove soil TaxID=2817434 RepID=UPI001A9D4A96|nr:MBL fold metallo-hydrolase [Streptomyces sp. VRA16 Mangrove soil]MBO1332630.1 MBL fold metallo-hydrolase [Streptomyces sp. VRA16 Mangrove soil]
MTETLAPHGHGLGSAAPQTMREVADRVFAYVQPEGGWCVNNAGVLVGSDRVTVIDTAATETRARALRQAIGDLTTSPPRVLVNTHFHGDHTFGNAFVGGSDAVIVAHEKARTEMAAAGLGLAGLWPDVEWGGISVTLPHLTYEDRLVLHLDDRRAELLHVGPAHTTNDTVVWLPHERVLFAGDVLMSGCTPFVLMGSVRGSLRAVERLRALDPLLVVGGHGPVCGPEVLDETAAYLRRIQQLAADGAKAGLTPLQTAREAGPGPYAHWLDAERLVGNLHRAYAELAGGPDGEPLDVVSVFGELVTYNGGRLPACYA